MNKLICLFLVFLSSFSVNNIVNKETIEINWYPTKLLGKELGYTTNAGYKYPGSQTSQFYKSFPLNKFSNDYTFFTKNSYFGEINPCNPKYLLDELPKKTTVTQQVVKTNKKNSIISSVLKSGRWVKISTSSNGIYKIPWSRLRDWGFSSPSDVQVYGAGGVILPENPDSIIYNDLPHLSVWHGKSNNIECLFFYSPGIIEWNYNQKNNRYQHKINPYTSIGHFFLTQNSEKQKNIQQLEKKENSATNILSIFDGHSLYKKEKYNLLSSGKKWFSNKFIHGATKNYSFRLTDIDISKKISIRINAAARSSSPSSMRISVNNKTIGDIAFNKIQTDKGSTIYANDKESHFLASAQSENFNISIQYIGKDSNAEAWLDFIEINYKKQPILIDKPIYFKDSNTYEENFSLDFSIKTNTKNIKIWDISDVFNIKEIPFTTEQNKIKGNYITGHEYIAFTPDYNFPEPKYIEEIKNQNLHNLTTPDYLIISHPLFLSQAEKIAHFHRTNSNMTVHVIDVNQIYNEYSSGNIDATGIRNFIKMFYNRHEGLKYILLIGDGSYDNKNIKQKSNNYIPTYQSANSLNPLKSFTTDDYYVILDKGESVYNGSVDLGIGRLPVSNTSQANAIIKKITDYYSTNSLGNWRNKIVFIADDGDNMLHMTDSEKLAGQVNETHSEFITNKIYLDAYKKVSGSGGESYPEVTKAINNQVKEGALILNYVGHANERYLAEEKILDISQINSWSNTNKYPIFVTATCEFSRFDGDNTSAGEYILFNPNGGGIGLFSTTRMVFAYSNYLLSKNFYNFVFENNNNGEHLRLGDIMRLAKTNTINTINKRNFSLLADPALILSYPVNRVITSTINNHNITITDTLKALQKVTISGYIANNKGDKLTNFSGTIIPTVYDKPVTTKTIGNGGATPMEFEVQENIIFQGDANVNNGEFTFSFVIPKDISYAPGKGKITYYASNGQTDAHGVFNNLIFGGMASDISDNQGPNIKLFLNSPNFTSGDNVSKNPTLIALLSDKNGINTTGTGIGHDITAIIDNKTSETIALNKYYKSNIGDYKSGKITYQLKNLSDGFHTLKLKAWDVANNSSEAEIYFNVNTGFLITEVYNYPNPVKNYTYFIFEHNQSDAIFDVLIEIYDTSGQQIDHFYKQVGSTGKNSSPIRWDITNSKILLRNGLYFYRIIASNNDGIITSKTGKFLLNR